MTPTLQKWLDAATAAYVANQAKGCTCKAPTVSGKMKFTPRAVDCPLHGELACS